MEYLKRLTDKELKELIEELIIIDNGGIIIPGSRFEELRTMTQKEYGRGYYGTYFSKNLICEEVLKRFCTIIK